MKESTDKKSFTDCLFDFLGDPEGLSRQELDIELEDMGIDVAALQLQVAEIAKKASEQRRLSWQDRAAEKRARIEQMLSSKGLSAQASNIRHKIIQVLQGGYGQEALSYAETYFRKKEGLSEKDMESLIEDLEDLNLLDDSGRKEK